MNLPMLIKTGSLSDDLPKIAMYAFLVSEIPKEVYADSIREEDMTVEILFREKGATTGQLICFIPARWINRKHPELVKNIKA